MQLLKNIVGRKILMAVSGQYMVLFVIFHLLGNTFNPYSMTFPNIGSFIQALRFLLFLMFVIHTIFGVLITLENNRAKPDSYAIRKNLRTDLAAKTMIWSGVLAGLFIICHLLQYTFLILEKTLQESYVVAAFYAAGLAALFLHLYHGIASFFQTMGWNNDRSLPVISKLGKGAAVILLAGFISIILFNRI